MWNNAAMFYLALPTSEKINLTTSPDIARMYTFINLTGYPKELHGNGRKVWVKGQEYDSIYMTSYSVSGKRYIQAGTVTMMYDGGKWYVVAAY